MGEDWRPSCGLDALRLRARLLRQIRAFFHRRGVLEVETPLLGNAIGTDPQLAYFRCHGQAAPARPPLHLQTSPEFAMKRLLAAGSGCIFQICKAFRDGESGRRHNPEFTLLEWYRVGFDLPRLMDEAEQLMGRLCAGLGLAPPVRLSYQEVFLASTGLDPLAFDRRRYADRARACGLAEADGLCGDDHPLWLDFLFSHLVQPTLGGGGLALVHGYPACQPSLARRHSADPRVVERVELFIDGLELGNGYHELACAAEQALRFDRDLALRAGRGLPLPAKDLRLLAALRAGLPDCAGMAIGLDRLLMVLTGSAAIDQVLAFPLDRA